MHRLRLFSLVGLLLLQLTTVGAHAEILGNVKPVHNEKRIVQQSPSSDFTERTFLLNGQSIAAKKTVMPLDGHDLVLALPFAKSGTVTFCLPLILPKFSEPNHNGEIKVSFQADLVRGTF